MATLANSYAGSYMGYNLIEISVEEYKRSRYVSQCRVINDNPLRATIFVCEDEYRYAKEKEARECQQMYYSVTWIDQQTCATACDSGTNILNPQPVKKKEEKVAKSIRHQYLRKRILDRIK